MPHRPRHHRTHDRGERRFVCRAVALRQASDPSATRWRTPALGYDWRPPRVPGPGQCCALDLLGRGCARDVPMWVSWACLTCRKAAVDRSVMPWFRPAVVEIGHLRGLLLRRFEPRNTSRTPVRVSW